MKCYMHSFSNVVKAWLQKTVAKSLSTKTQEIVTYFKSSHKQPKRTSIIQLDSINVGAALLCVGPEQLANFTGSGGKTRK